MRRSSDAVIALILLTAACAGGENTFDSGRCNADGGTLDGDAATTDGATPDGSQSSNDAATRDSSSDGGFSNDGSLGDGGQGLPPSSNVALAVSYTSSCVIEVTQKLPKCWGFNAEGELGIGSTATHGQNLASMGDALPYVNLGALRTATALSSSQQHSCALLDTGVVRCWGYNSSGQLGIGNTTTIGDSQDEVGNFASVDLGPGHIALAVSVGDRFSCALLADHTVKCWGEAMYGKLGSPQSHGASAGTMGANLPIVNLGTGRTAKSIAAGSDFACAVLDNGAVKCWGHNDKGQLGLGDNQDRGGGALGDQLPAVDLGAHKATTIATGNRHACAILDDGSMRCWGYNANGQLGLEDRATRGLAATDMGANLPAVKLGAGRTAVAIAAGMVTCALLDNNALKCWGPNPTGALGRGDTKDVGGDFQSMGDNLAPIDLGAGARKLIGIGAYDHVCALFDDGSVKCWGYGAFGQLGNGVGTRGANPNEMGTNLPFVKLTGP